VEKQSKAYRNHTIRQKQLIQDRIENKTVLVFKKPSDGTVKALVKQTNGLNYSLNSEYLEETDGNRWAFSGEQFNGNNSMRQVVPQGFYWFAWSKFNPETEIYRENP
jgi:hypothetical protein